MITQEAYMSFMVNLVCGIFLALWILGIFVFLFPDYCFKMMGLKGE
jgi:hypothetical protein